MTRYLITGGAGFIGSHIASAALAQGSQVVVLDNFLSGKRENLEDLQGDLDVIEGSVTVADDVARAARGCDGIFHLGAVPSVALSVERPLASHEANSTGTITVLDVARKQGIKVVYAGSSSAYGNQEPRVLREDLREGPLSPYSAAKLSGELYCRSFANVYGLPIVVTRFFNVYGPRQVPDSPYSGVIAAFCFALLRGNRPIVHGTGQQARDFTFVKDVARGCLLAMEASTEGCQTVNLACGGSHSVLDILVELKLIAGVDGEPTFEPSRVGDVMYSQADVSRARELFGFESEYSLASGLRETFDWYRRVHA